MVTFHSYVSLPEGSRKFGKNQSTNQIDHIMRPANFSPKHPHLGIGHGGAITRLRFFHTFASQLAPAIAIHRGKGAIVCFGAAQNALLRVKKASADCDVEKCPEMSRFFGGSRCVLSKVIGFLGTSRRGNQGVSGDLFFFHIQDPMQNPSPLALMWPSKKQSSTIQKTQGNWRHRHQLAIQFLGVPGAISSHDR